MGESNRAALALFFAMTSVLLVFLAIIAYVNGVLRRFRQISPAEAIRFGISQEQSGAGKHFRLSNNRLLGTNAFLGMNDVLGRRKIYLTMLAVLVISAFIIIVPQNLHNTLSSNDFITYMGVGISDLRIDIQQTDNIPERASEIAAAMENDNAIANYVVLTTKTYSVKTENGSAERIKVELGDHSVFPLAYAAGRAPAENNEIALSVMNADELGKTVGDVILIMIEGEERAFTVSGIYADITNGGKTAKAVFSDPSPETMWSVISAELADASLVDTKVAEYAGRFDYAKVSNIDEYIMQTYGATIRAIGKAAYAAIVVALTITVLITLLFMKMLVAKDRYEIAVLKAFGYTNSDVKAQYVARSVFVLVLGISLGTLLANTLGEALTGSVLASFGASSFDFVVNPLVAYLISPGLMVIAVLMATIFGTRDAAQTNISQNIKE